MTSLVHSPWAPHHYHKTGLYFSGGSETSSSAQNVQTVYSFLRGSAKQYGLTVYGQVCVCGYVCVCLFFFVSVSVVVVFVCVYMGWWWWWCVCVGGVVRETVPTVNACVPIQSVTLLLTLSACD